MSYLRGTAVSSCEPCRGIRASSGGARCGHRRMRGTYSASRGAVRSSFSRLCRFPLAVSRSCAQRHMAHVCPKVGQVSTIALACRTSRRSYGLGFLFSSLTAAGGLTILHLQCGQSGDLPRLAANRPSAFRGGACGIEAARPHPKELHPHIVFPHPGLWAWHASGTV